MTFGRLVRSSLRHHWRAHLGVYLGAAVAVIVLVGALTVGDSIRYSLRSIALARLGEVRLALTGQSRLFRAELAGEVAQDLGIPVAPVLLLRGTASRDGEDGPVRTGSVRVVGVDPAFYRMAPGGGGAPDFGPAGDQGVVLNQPLARKLGASVGEELLLRVDKPSLLSRDAPLSKVDDATVAVRVTVRAIATEAEFGRFGLEANQAAPLTAFLPLEMLQARVDQPGRANALLVGGTGSGTGGVEAATTALRRHWGLSDAALEIRRLPGKRGMELRTDRVFLDPPVAQAALKALPGAEGVLTYFVNELRVGSRATPYSTVAAVRRPPGAATLGPNEIVINDWLARDLRAAPGQKLAMRYFVVGLQRKLEERVAEFTIRAVVPLTGEAADPDLMPDIPGLADAKNCRDWEPGVPVDLDRIRDVDEAYWDAHRGTPKAFVSLAAGQALWNNRFGNLTAVRYPIGPGEATLDACLRQGLNPGALGLYFLPVRDQALQAGAQSLDFGQLFVGFSLFLIAAGLMLTALLFTLGVERRAEEIGILLALGITPGRIRRLLLIEGAGTAAAASVTGLLLGTLYTRIVIGALSTVWSGAVAGSALQHHAEPTTVAVGAAAGFVAAVVSIALALRGQARSPVRVLLAPGGAADQATDSAARAWAGLPSSILGLGGGAALALVGTQSGHEVAAGAFFGAGALLLIGGLGVTRLLLRRWEAGGGPLTVTRLAVRNCARRRSRSLGVVALLASGSFVVVAVGANRHDPAADATRRSSGTGGFAFYGEATLPVYQDLDLPEGLDTFALTPEDVPGMRVVSLRLREGDEASCLNLNRAQLPRLLGVNPEEFRSRGAFGFSATTADDPWVQLAAAGPEGEVPVFGDVNTVTWSLGKKLGDTVTVLDDRGGSVRLKIAGILKNSVLQGSLVMAESAFTRHFPSQSGYQVFLIDAPESGRVELARTLTRAMEDAGLDLTPTSERLAEFNSVEDTYLSIFAVLGGLGLVLGTVGLGVVVLRNALDRRAELAVLRSVGFTHGRVHWLLYAEHALLLFLGLIVGLAAGIAAVVPSISSPGVEIPYGTIGGSLMLVVATGLAATWIATSLASRAPVLDALRGE